MPAEITRCEVRSLCKKEKDGGAGNRPSVGLMGTTREFGITAVSLAVSPKVMKALVKGGLAAASSLGALMVTKAPACGVKKPQMKVTKTSRRHSRDDRAA